MCEGCYVYTGKLEGNWSIISILKDIRLLFMGSAEAEDAIESKLIRWIKYQI